jgi:uncharacterized protein YkwD
MRSGILLAAVNVLLFSCETFTGALASISTSLSNLSASDAGTAGSSDPGRRADPDAAHWDIDALDTARDAEYLTGLEKDVVLEMNKARSSPKKYAELYIQPRLRYYSGNNYSEPGQITIVTREGKKAVEDCAAALSRMQSSPLLTPELGLSRGAKDHTADQGKTGQTGHNGSDRSTPFTRIERYGGGYNRAGENLAYGSRTGRDIVVDLLVDDGVPSRGHRANIMDRRFTQTGVSCGTHPQFRTMCAITYANGYVNK